MELDDLTKLFARSGAVRLYAKELSENDNSKNQIYLAGNVDALGAFPFTTIKAENTQKSGPTFKAEVDFSWLQPGGDAARAPAAQLILYSQYPEVRLSGVLRGCSAAPNDLLADRDRAATFSAEQRERLIGRVLFLGVTKDRRILGWLAAGGSVVEREFKNRSLPHAFVVFKEVPLPDFRSDDDCRRGLLDELRRIHHKGWIDSRQLDSSGASTPCCAPQCGGFTLEAELGIAKNSMGEPDFLGWEVKQHAVKAFGRASGPITLMTPEPTGGFYKSTGAEAFVRKYGYPDKNGKDDRLNFGGIFKVGAWNRDLCLTLSGYDVDRNLVSDATGAIELIDRQGSVAASWAFSGILLHWAQKHRRAVYVPSVRRTEPTWQYQYGNQVRLGSGTDGLRFLAACAMKNVYYDPALKLEEVSSVSPKLKRRSQFRIASKGISALYTRFESVSL